MPKNNPRYIIVHCSAGPDRVTRDWPAIREYHMKNRGWTDIGYHFGVERVGDGFEVVKGRPVDQSGAHCVEQQMNYRSIGVCMVGGDPGEGFGDKYPLPREQYLTTLRLIADLCRQHSIPVEHVKGHREYAPYKTCPGVGVDLDLLRRDVAKQMISRGDSVESDTGEPPDQGREELKVIVNQLADCVRRLRDVIR